MKKIKDVKVEEYNGFVTIGMGGDEEYQLSPVIDADNISGVYDSVRDFAESKFDGLCEENDIDVATKERRYAIDQLERIWNPQVSRFVG